MAGVRCPACGREAPASAIRCPACAVVLAGAGDAALAARVAGALGPHYRVDEVIGRGGFAIVFRVRDLRLDRDVAAKTLHPELAAHRELADRFRQEVLTAARLNHPNIVPIYFVSDEPAATYVMPLIEGETLAARLRREGQLPMAVALGILRDVAGALDYAHDAGIIHRDVKPDNVVIESRTGRSLLMDFGIAKALAGDTVVTASGVVVGTPHYMSPEQIAGEGPVERRSDVYSLGVMTYEMLAGGPPFEGATAAAVFALHAAERAPALRDRRPDVKEAVAAVIDRALAKLPAERMDSAGALRDALERAHGRVSLRRSGEAVIERQPADDMRLFRSVGTARGSAVVALRDANDLGAMAEAVNAAMASTHAAIERLDISAALEHVMALASRRDDPRPAFRQAPRDALRRLATDLDAIDMLAGAWRGGNEDVQGGVEQALSALLPDVAPALVEVAARSKSAEFVLLADRVGAIDGRTAEWLARHASAAVAQAFGVALRESTRPGRTIEQWLGMLARHPHPAVRALAVDTAGIHGGAVGERIARLLIADREATPRRAAIAALGASRRPGVLPDLASLLEHGDVEDRCAAAAALGALGLSEAVPVLDRVFARRRLLRAERGPVQRAAARALAALPMGLGRDSLARLRDDADGEVRAIARSVE